MDQRRRFSAFVAAGHDPRPSILDAIEFAREFMNQTGLCERTVVKVSIIVEELVSNALRHGGGDCDVSLWMSLSRSGDAVVLEVEDDGASFNLAKAPAFTSPHPQTGGGIGIAIVRAWAQDMVYARRGNHNVLSLKIG
ncbi:sensor histidine kinase [Erythrobacter sp. NAP1]|uniref:ATP-binding protein n=1 Tax=Erythrobacter sp. NAP1 TaxID=237727 RepID=UPI00006851C8|nr:ATP-binding protein [Erythrobacter sp. NAP1]EAQ27659.1 sensor histidine kinase [Erythrobacter sp. NAP1]